MTFADIHLLGLLGVLLALALGAAWRTRAARTHARATGVTSPVHTATVHRGRQHLRSVCLWAGLGLGVVALAGPRWGASEQVRTAKGADLLVLIDCSRSMLANDLFPSRLEVARRKALALMDAAPETRIALMPFAAIPVLRCPLTGDRAAVGEMLRDCDPDLFPADQGYQGTAIGTALKEGLQVLGRQVERGQAILVITDGADPDAATVKAAAEAAVAAGIPVNGLFVADPEKKPTLVIDGKTQVMTSDRTTLDALATSTRGLAVNATLDDADVTALAQHISTTVSSRAWEERARIVASERFQWPLALAILLVSLGVLLPTRKP